jgi:hypothetical protein
MAAIAAIFFYDPYSRENIIFSNFGLGDTCVAGLSGFVL